MYNKLFSSILDSSIWLKPDPVRIVWITLLAAMDEDGYTHFSTIENLANRARVSPKDARLAVEMLESPELETTDEYQGRRIERVPGGFQVLKAEYYRQLVTRDIQRVKTRERVRRFREAKRGVTPVTKCNDLVTQSDTYTYTNQSKSKSRASALPIGFSQTMERQAYAKSKGILDVAAEFEAFIAHHTAHGKVMKDWDAAWHTWCINTKKFGSKEGKRKLSDAAFIAHCRAAGINTVGRNRDELECALREKLSTFTS